MKYGAFTTLKGDRLPITGTYQRSARTFIVFTGKRFSYLQRSWRVNKASYEAANRGEDISGLGR